MDAVLERDEEGYLVRLPEELVSSLRWSVGEKLRVEISEWKGRIVLVVYKKTI